MHEAIRLLAIRDRAVDVGEVYAAVEDPGAGGLAVFVGTVRDHDEGKAVSSLDYSAHPTAAAALEHVAAAVADRFDVVSLAAVHRVGALQVGDVAVAVAIGCGHRGDAFAACRELIDSMKQQVPIWKHQRFTDGTEEWVGTP